MAAPFWNVLKAITQDKKKWDELSEEEQTSFTPWLLNKFISMKQEYCEVVNIVQKNSWQISNKNIYNIYLDLIPKSYVFLKYIKNQNKNNHDPEEIEAIQKYFEVSSKIAKEYADNLHPNDIKTIIQQINGK